MPLQVRCYRQYMGTRGAAYGRVVLQLGYRDESDTFCALLHSFQAPTVRHNNASKREPFLFLTPCG